MAGRYSDVKREREKTTVLLLGCIELASILHRPKILLTNNTNNRNTVSRQLVRVLTVLNSDTRKRDSTRSR